MNRRLVATLFCLCSIRAGADDVLNGDYSANHENNVKKIEGRYSNGEMTSTWSRWYPNGQIKSRGRWDKNRPEGHWIFWYDNGEKQAEGDFYHGERVGQWRTWDASGNAQTAEFPNSQLSAMKFDGKSVRLNASRYSQKSGGNFNTLEAFWSPHFILNDQFRLRGLIGLAPLKNAAGSVFVASDTEVLLSYGKFTGMDLSVEAGGGVQIWFSQRASPAIFSVNLLSAHWVKQTACEFLAGFSMLPYPQGDTTLDLKIGVNYSF